MTDDAHPNGGVRIDADDLSDIDSPNGLFTQNPSLLTTSQANGGISPTGSIGRSAGKSGRVIEKLMAENDRLRRELKSETAKREEEQRRAEAARSSRDSLQSINENLIHQTNIDKLKKLKTSLSRKDRKIEELRSEREENVQKRVEAETNLKKYVSETDATVQTMKESLSAEASDKERLSRQYETLQKSWKHLEDGYKVSLNRLKRDIEAIHTEQKKDRTSVQKLEIIIEQQRQELEKMRLAKNKITQTYEERISTAEEEMKKIRALQKEEDEEAGSVLEEARLVAGQLKHLLGVRQAMRDLPDSPKDKK